MEQITAQQAKMVIEYFSKQAAEDMPIITSYSGDDEKHIWITRFQTSIAIERQIGAWWWEALVEAQMNLQSFDRDPAAFIHERGFTERTDLDNLKQYLEDQVSWAVDNAYNNAGQ